VRRGVNVGDQVRVERAETRYPSKGTWPRFRGRTGTVVEINRDRKRPHLIEYGVVFGKVRNPNENGSIAMGAKTSCDPSLVWPLRAPLAHRTWLPR